MIQIENRFSDVELFEMFNIALRPESDEHMLWHFRPTFIRQSVENVDTLSSKQAKQISGQRQDAERAERAEKLRAMYEKVVCDDDTTDELPSMVEQLAESSPPVYI